jgi:hypothetical protein
MKYQIKRNVSKQTSRRLRLICKILTRKTKKYVMRIFSTYEIFTEVHINVRGRDSAVCIAAG